MKTKYLSSQHKFIILVILSLATIATHWYLSALHYNLKLGLSEGSSLCNVSTTFNCDSVATSKYASLFGVPVAVLGLWTQLVYLILLLTAQFKLSEFFENIKRLLFWLSSFIAIISVVMFSISTLKLGTYCLVCMLAYLFSWLQLLFTASYQDNSALPQFGKDIGVFFTQCRWPIVVLALTPGFALLSNNMVLDNFGMSKLNIIVEESVIGWQQAPTMSFDENKGLTIQRNQGPYRMVIVEFADFLCPHCRVAYPTLEAFAQGHPDVKLIFKPFPLDGKCNKDLKQQGDGLRCQLAASVFCAEQMGQKGWAAHHWIFDRQESIHSKSFDWIRDQLSQELKIDSKELQKCVDSDPINELIAATSKEGFTAKIPGTPAIFVNGKNLDRGYFLPVLQEVYNKISN
jgi:protein-disulfide isomerase/uncharacterized membrane protein